MLETQSIKNAFYTAGGIFVGACLAVALTRMQLAAQNPALPRAIFTESLGLCGLAGVALMSVGATLRERSK